MKKLLYILPLMLLLLSCNEDPTQVQKDKRFKTVYGLERSLVNGQIAGVIGDISKNSCTNDEDLGLSIFPNPAAFTTTFQFNTNSNRSYELFIETAIGNNQFLDSLSASGSPSNYEYPQHESYFKKSLYKGEISAGSNSISLELNEFDAGIYYIIYEDSEGNSDCYPLLIQRFE